VSGLPLETRTTNVKPVALTVLELLAFYGQKCRGSCNPGHAHFEKKLRGHVGTVPGNTYGKFEVRSFNRGTAKLFCKHIMLRGGVIHPLRHLSSACHKKTDGNTI